MIFAESEKALLIRAVHSFPLFLALGKIIQRVNKCPRAGHKNIWMIAATHRRTAIFAQTHCHFSKRVHAAGNGINGILLKFRLSPHYLGYDIEQGINRPHAKARAAFSMPSTSMSTAAVGGTPPASELDTETWRSLRLSGIR